MVVRYIIFQSYTDDTHKKCATDLVNKLCTIGEAKEEASGDSYLRIYVEEEVLPILEDMSHCDYIDMVENQPW